MDSVNYHQGWLRGLLRGILCLALAVSVVGQAFSHAAQAMDVTTSITMAYSNSMPSGGQGRTIDGLPTTGTIVDCEAHGCWSMVPADVEIGCLLNERRLSALEPFPGHVANVSRLERPPRV